MIEERHEQARSQALADPRALEILTTEHASLLSTRALSYNEAFSLGATLALGVAIGIGGFVVVFGSIAVYGSRTVARRQRRAESVFPSRG